MSNLSQKELEVLSALGPKSRDPIWFTENVLGVRLNGAQKRWMKLAVKRQGGDHAPWRMLYRFLIHVSGNQVGKTTGIACMIIWAAHVKAGLRDDNWDAWFSTPYRWLHLGPTHPIALLTLQAIGLLMRGAHPAQIDRETGLRRKVLWTQEMYRETKFDGQYPGFILWNSSEIHFRTTDDHAKGLQGMVVNGLSLDEAAFEDNLADVTENTLKLRVAANEGPIWMVSTPNGINDYFEYVQDILDHGTQTFHPRVWEDPARAKALIWSHLEDNAGYGFSHEQIEFMESDIEEAVRGVKLRGEFSEPSEAFFVPQTTINEAFDSRLPERVEPQNGHRYVIFWDPSGAEKGGDPTVVVVLDTTSRPIKGVYFERWEKPLPIQIMIQKMYELHTLFNSRNLRGNDDDPAPRAVTGFDATSLGGVFLKQLLGGLRPQRPVNFGGSKVKIKALTDLRGALSKRAIIIPEAWLRMKREILNYKLDDNKIVQDCVMALAGASYIALQGFQSWQSRPFDTGYKTVGRW